MWIVYKKQFYFSRKMLSINSGTLQNRYTIISIKTRYAAHTNWAWCHSFFNVSGWVYGCLFLHLFVLSFCSFQYYTPRISEMIWFLTFSVWLIKGGQGMVEEGQGGQIHGDRRRPDSGWWTYNVRYRWCVTKFFTWNLGNFANNWHPYNFS